MKESCVFCGSEASQKHHVKYDPEMAISICVPCHLKLHEHGVGMPEGKIVKEILLQEEDIVHPPHFLKLIQKGDIPYVVTKSNEEVVAKLICANECKMGWNLYYSQQVDQFYLRCPNCGYDIIIAPEIRKE